MRQTVDKNTTLEDIVHKSIARRWSFTIFGRTQRAPDDGPHHVYDLDCAGCLAFQIMMKKRRYLNRHGQRASTQKLAFQDYKATCGTYLFRERTPSSILAALARYVVCDELNTTHGVQNSTSMSDIA